MFDQAQAGLPDPEAEEQDGRRDQEETPGTIMDLFLFFLSSPQLFKSLLISIIRTVKKKKCIYTIQQQYNSKLS